jgi:LysM domain
MAAIIEPRRHHAYPAPRPALRLVTTDGRTVEAPVSLGLTPAHAVAAVIGLALVVLLSIAVSTGALAGLAPAPAGSAASGPAAAAAAGPTTELTVEAGDTFWSIARQLQPTGDVRPLVDELIDLNGTTMLQPGARITVPA